MSLAVLFGCCSDEEESHYFRGAYSAQDKRLGDSKSRVGISANLKFPAKASVMLRWSQRSQALANCKVRIYVV